MTSCGSVFPSLSAPSYNQTNLKWLCATHTTSCYCGGKFPFFFQPANLAGEITDKCHKTFNFTIGGREGLASADVSRTGNRLLEWSLRSVYFVCLNWEVGWFSYANHQCTAIPCFLRQGLNASQMLWTVGFSLCPEFVSKWRIAMYFKQKRQGTFYYTCKSVFLSNYAWHTAACYFSSYHYDLNLLYSF